MKKYIALLVSLLLVCMVSFALAAEGPFVPGEDFAEYEIENASGYNVVTVNMLITAGEDKIFDGKVKLTSDSLLASEFTQAAVFEAGCGADGIESGFVTFIGDYANGPDANGNYVCWTYTVNGKYVPLACNQFVLLEGDYIHWDYVAFSDSSEDVSEVVEAAPTGFVPPFEVGEDETEYEVEGASGYTVETVNVKIVAGEDVLFNGKVKLTSDTVLASEFTQAAVYEAGCGADGIESGFVTYIGDYANGNDADGNYVYWSLSINGKYVPVSCNQIAVLDGDYILWDFVTYVAE